MCMSASCIILSQVAQGAAVFVLGGEADGLGPCHQTLSNALWNQTNWGEGSKG